MHPPTSCHDDDAVAPAAHPRTLRVVIADDHPFYRAGLARMLERNQFEVIADVPNGEATMRVVEDQRPDVVVVDLNMPGTSGLATIRRLATMVPAVPVLVLSVSADDQDVTDAILAGASGYMLKDRPHPEIVAGIRAAAAGQAPLSPRIAAMLIRRLRATESVGDDEIQATLARYLGRAGPDGPGRPGRGFSRRW
jgi:DNA-binding NarL/FixJ family response regulator